MRVGLTRLYALCWLLFCVHCADRAPTDAGREAGTARDSAEPDNDSESSDGSDPSDASSSDANSLMRSDAALDAGVRTDAATSGDAGAGAAVPTHTFVFVGGYSDKDPLRVYEIDRTSYALTPIAQDAGVGAQPSYITPSADGRTLYVANESDTNAGITVLRVNETTGIATRIDHEDAISSAYVFSALSPDGKYLLATSYNGGNLGVYPVKADGSLDARVDMRSFGADAQSHSVRVHPTGSWVYVPNKGLDSLALLKLDAAGKLSDNTPTAFPPLAMRGSFDGPRHIAFSADGKFAFVILELGDALISLSIQADGGLSELDRKPRAASGTAAGSDTGAHVLAHPSGNFVYGSNRGSNTIVAFAYDAQGKLSLLGHVPSRGRTPRDFDIDPLGKFLIAANQEGDSGGTLAVFAIEQDGRLTPKGNALTGLSSPAAVAIVAH